jgi:hypothetical protein
MIAEKTGEAAVAGFCGPMIVNLISYAAPHCIDGNPNQISATSVLRLLSIA